jgi:hypothetical protein
MSTLFNRHFRRNITTLDLVDAWDHADHLLVTAARDADLLGRKADADALILVLEALRRAWPDDLRAEALAARAELDYDPPGWAG